MLLMFDRDTRRVYRLFDFTKRLRPIPGRAYCVAGKVNSVNTFIWLLSRSSWTANTGGLLLLLFQMKAQEAQAMS